MVTKVGSIGNPFSRTWKELMGRLPRLVPLTFIPTLVLFLLLVVLFSEVTTGAGGRTFEVDHLWAVVPPGVTTAMLWLPLGGAPAAITNVAVICVELTTVRPETVMPVGRLLMVVVPIKLVPMRVTGTLVPATPDVRD
jgi:hypothetical protein